MDSVKRSWVGKWKGGAETLLAATEAAAQALDESFGVHTTVELTWEGQTSTRKSIKEAREKLLLSSPPTTVTASLAARGEQVDSDVFHLILWGDGAGDVRAVGKGTAATEVVQAFDAAVAVLEHPSRTAPQTQSASTRPWWKDPQWIAAIFGGLSLIAAIVIALAVS